MKRLLGEAGFFAYLDALNQPYTRALRVNLLLRPDGTPPCPIEGLGAPVPWAKGAYFVEGDARPGLSPLHEVEYEPVKHSIPYRNTDNQRCI